MQIWLVFAAITLGVTIILSIVLPWILRDFFTREIYATIDSAQSLVLQQEDQPLDHGSLDNNIFKDRRKQLQDIRTVNHFLVSENGNIIAYPPLQREFLQDVAKKVQGQTEDSKEYTAEVDKRTIFYVARRENTPSGNNIYLISYMWDTYRDGLVQTLFQRILLIMGGVLLFSWIPSLLLAKYLSKPLVALEQRVEKLTNREWSEPVALERNDEIGKLGQSIEQLRKQLIHHDEVEQSFLQHVSHELKTPVMVIRSYTQSIRDGIYPKGDLNNTVEVIDEEALQLEKRIRNLLYLTKLDYMETHEKNYETFSFSELIQEVSDRLRLLRRELDWSLDLAPIEITGEKEQWRVVLENLLDNQIRYAKNEIVISLSQKSQSIVLHIYNDGPPIEEESINTIFAKFNKGHKGKFGLGLAVVQRIVNLHGAKVWVENENQGVSFYVEF
ncbi:sensor histidine kinase [Natranaerobius trueperi]|nr:HAMP domain-containing sensor histidine kinase [Natranaerobius trueperi]